MVAPPFGLVFAALLLAFALVVGAQELRGGAPTLARKLAAAPTLAPNWTKHLNETADGRFIFEGDMILPKKMIQQAVDEGSIVQKEHGKEEIVTETIDAPLFMRWTNGVVPYVVHKDLKCKFLGCLFRNPEKHILNAMKEWEDKTCITFRKRKNTDRDYVHFVSAGSGVCASHIGRSRGRQPIYLGKGCRKDGIIIHEIGHALGFFHEQSRPDRDQFITVHYENMNSKYWMNFKKYTTGISNMGTPYDYESIMHYAKGSFSTSAFSSTITPKQSGVSIGQREKLSSIDIKEAKLYYDCP